MSRTGTTLVAPARPQLHRGMANYSVDHIGMFAGLVSALVLLLLVLVFAPVVWQIQERAIWFLLDVGGVQDQIGSLPAPVASGLLPAGGAGFEVLGLRHTALPVGWGLVLIGTSMLVAIAAFRARPIPMPAKVMVLFAVVLFQATVAYNVWISPAPPHDAGIIYLGTFESGLLISVIAGLLFAFQVFPIPGRLDTKIAWLAGLVVFSLTFNVVRVAFVLATLVEFGSLPSLALHYASGIFVDFIYVVFFFSLAAHHLASQAAEDPRKVTA